METVEPVPYEFSHHAAVAPRRVMNSAFGPNHLPFYNPTSFQLPFQSPSPAAYHYDHTVSPHAHHPGPYQHYFLTGQQPLTPEPVRLRSEPPLQSIPDIRPAKNAFNRGARLPASNEESPQTQSSPIHPSSSTPSQTRSPVSTETEFSTEVDVLMKAIQAKPDSQPLPSQQVFQTHGNTSASPGTAVSTSGSTVNTFPVPDPYPISLPSPPRCILSPQDQISRSGKKRKYNCTLPHCGKSFAQKTHLDIHMRAHTGDKPFSCKEPLCGQRFSQLGNLKTHQRRHTGEKPFSCDICQKRFAQRGNVRAHKVTHENSKPFKCLLDECGKKFTQLGNLKSHQNKFHSSTLRTLTARFGQITNADAMNPQDRGLWEYFATLYKNSNKGIKGRGKDRRINSSGSSSSSSSGSVSGSAAGSGMPAKSVFPGHSHGGDSRLQRVFEDSSTCYTGSEGDEEELEYS